MRIFDVSQDHPAFDAVEVITQRLLVALSRLLKVSLGSISLTRNAERGADSTAKLAIRGVLDLT